MENKIIVKGKLVCNGMPWHSDGMIVKLFDQDMLDDDFLGQSKITGEGNFEIKFYPEDYVSFDSPFETKPDLYFCIYLFGDLLFRSRLWSNVDVKNTSINIPEEGRLIDLGTFNVHL